MATTKRMKTKQFSKRRLGRGRLFSRFPMLAETEVAWFRGDIRRAGDHKLTLRNIALSDGLSSAVAHRQDGNAQGAKRWEQHSPRFPLRLALT
jgi:hypothetical protein